MVGLALRGVSPRLWGDLNGPLLLPDGIVRWWLLGKVSVPIFTGSKILKQGSTNRSLSAFGPTGNLHCPQCCAVKLHSGAIGQLFQSGPGGSCPTPPMSGRCNQNTGFGLGS